MYAMTVNTRMMTATIVEIVVMVVSFINSLKT